MDNLAVIIIVYGLFSFTNGYNGTIIMSFAGTDIEDDKERALVGSFMSLLLNIAIAVACFVSIPISNAMD